METLLEKEVSWGLTAGTAADELYNLFGRRYYDPEIGAFTSSDPMEQDWSGYAYCGGDPINFIDPFGLADIGITPEMVTQDIDNMIAYTNALEASISNIPMGTLFSAVIGSDPTRFSSYYLNWNSSTEGAYVAAPIEGAGMASAPLVIGGAAPPVTDVARSSVTSAVQGSAPLTTANVTSLASPLANIFVNSPYGAYRTIGTNPHVGVDLRAAVGTEAYAPYAGLLYSVPNSRYNTVTFTFTEGQHQGYQVQYLHMSQRAVAPGRLLRVNPGDVVGLTGRTGIPTGRGAGPHLHLQVRNPTGRIVNPSIIYGGIF